MWFAVFFIILLFCVVFIHNSMHFCSILTPLTSPPPSLTSIRERNYFGWMIKQLLELGSVWSEEYTVCSADLIECYLPCLALPPSLPHNNNSQILNALFCNLLCKLKLINAVTSKTYRLVSLFIANSKCFYGSWKGSLERDKGYFTTDFV